MNDKQGLVSMDGKPIWLCIDFRTVKVQYN